LDTIGCLAADETIEVFETRSGGPTIERTGWAALPHWDLVAFAELRGGIAVEPQLSWIVALLFGRRQFCPGAEVAVSVMFLKPTE
jgi:hypothetical protein